MIRRDCFGQCEIQQHCVREAQCRGKEKRYLNPPATEDAADCWSQNESETKRCTDQTHSLRAVLFGSDVGDVSLGGRDVSPRDAVEDAADKQHRKRCCESEYE